MASKDRIAFALNTSTNNLRFSGRKMILTIALQPKQLSTVALHLNMRECGAEYQPKTRQVASFAIVGGFDLLLA